MHYNVTLAAKSRFITVRRLIQTRCPIRPVQINVMKFNMLATLMISHGLNTVNSPLLAGILVAAGSLILASVTHLTSSHEGFLCYKIR